jgi:hypothetical protein
MGCLAWLRYLSHTQVIESSNLSPSINHRVGKITIKISKEKMLANITNNRTTKQKSFSNLNLYVTEFVKLEEWWYH